MRNDVGITPSGMLPLFDPAAADPPADAIELYFEAPLTVGLMFQLIATEDEQGDLRHYLPFIEDAREAGIAEALRIFMHFAEVKVGDHHVTLRMTTTGLRQPAQPRMTRVRHHRAAGHADTARLHDHVYLGRRAVSKADGQDYLLDLDSFDMVCRTMDNSYRLALQRSLSATADVKWSQPGSDGERAELVAPPLQRCLPDYPRVLCHWHRPLTHRWIVGDAQRHRDNPFLLENRSPGDDRPPWEDADDPTYRRAV